MLQPAEIDDVSQRFSNEIASMRRFLSQASITVENPQALRETAAKLKQSRTFHRDLMSHVWVLLDESDPVPRSADLLGILAIAAAGTRNAALTSEEDAHTLLRFIMEARHTFQAPVSPTQNLHSPPVTGFEGDIRPVSTNSVGPSVDLARRRQPLHLPSVEPSKPSSELQVARDPRRRKRRGVAPGVAAVFAIVSLVLCYFTLRNYRSSTNRRATIPDSTSTSGAAGVTASEIVGDSSHRTSSFDVSGDRQRLRSAAPAGHANLPAQIQAPARNGNSSTVAALNPAPTEPSNPLAVHQPTPPASSTFAVSAGSTSAVVGRDERVTGSLQRPGRPSNSVVAVPADTISKRLDSPRLPPYAYAEEGDKKRYPRLVRRHPYDAANDNADSNQTLTAELRAPDLPGAAPASRGSSAAGTVHGVVRSTCVGMMAANLISSPTPSYPTNAASARVQGQVRIEATVDRDGSINAARVISGPPLLREAALSAVEHWRYKPYISGGKAAPTATMAVLDFELQ